MTFQRCLLRTTLFLSPLAILPTLPSDDAAPVPPRPGLARYEVRITNLTRGQIMSPAVVAAHGADLGLWELGQPASGELAQLAEDAVLQPMVDKLNGMPQVSDVQVATGAMGPILPGETATVIVSADPSMDPAFSVAGMLVTTNDAFYGLTGSALPTRGTDSHLVPAYDAGSEANTEDCAHIPGPPCNNPMVRVTTGAEGFVHVHAGIHGDGSLRAAQYDWRNPTARITARRM